MNRLDALLEKRAKGDKRSAQQRLIAQGRKSRLKGPPGEEHKAARGVKKVRGSKETEGGRADTKTRAMMHKSAHPVLRAIAHKLGQGGEHGSAALRGKTEPEKGGGAHKGYKMVFGKWQKVEMMSRSTLDKLTEIREALEESLSKDEREVMGNQISHQHWQGVAGAYEPWAPVKDPNDLKALASLLKKGYVSVQYTLTSKGKKAYDEKQQ